MKRIFKPIGSFFIAAPRIILFELLYKLILTAIGAPFLALMLKVAMKAAKVNYLSGDSVISFLKSPVTYIVLLITLFVISFFTIVELSALIACFAASRQRQKITVTQMLGSGLKTFCKALKGSGITKILIIIVIFPLSQFTLSAGIFFSPVLPMLRSALGSVSNVLSVSVFFAVQLIIVSLLASRSYSLHYLALTKSNFSESIKLSKDCLNGKKLRMALSLLAWSLCIILFISVITFAVSFLIVLFVKGFSRANVALTTAITVLKYAGRVFSTLSTVISAPIIVCWLTGKFFNEANYDVKILPIISEDKKHSKAVKFAVMISAAAISVFLNFSYIQEIYKGNLHLNVNIFGLPQVTAHRGYSHIAPENTGYAFEEAIEIGADYAELDVQQTADGQVVVFHDSTINRTTDGKGELSSYTYDELQQFSNGSWFKKGEFADSRIMLLSDVLEQYGSDIMLNIEIKDHGATNETAQKTAELLVEYDMTDSCYVTSFSYAALKTVKKYEPEIKTGLITNVAASTVYSQLQYIDAVSLNYLFVNQNVVSTAHKNGKSVFVWTVNRTSDMNEMISIGVDNIITDRPDKASEAIYSYSKGDFVISILERIFGA